MWDYIVVGAGSSGCVVADRLSRSGSNNVLVLEAGSLGTPLLKILGAEGYLNLSRYDWSYISQPDNTRQMRTEQWPRGRVVGGSSTINGMNYVRGSRSDYDRWAAMGNTGWASADVMPLFRSIERHHEGCRDPIDYNIRGSSGPLHIRTVTDSHPATKAFIESACAEGYAYNPDYNGATQEGVGYAQLNQRRGFRCSSADAFLRPALRRNNFQLQTNAFVHRLLITERHVTGIRYERDGVLHDAPAHNVVLCAGAINTPKVLMLSGIGDAHTLRELGLGVVLDRPAVGRNLMEHPMIRLIYQTRIPTYNPVSGVLQKARFLAKFLLVGEGPLASIVEAQAFLKTSPELTVPDIQIHFIPLGLGYTTDNPYGVLRIPSVSILVNKSYPCSRGRITLASGDPRIPPLIEPNLLASDEDVLTLLQGVQSVRGIMKRAPMSELLNREVAPGTAAGDADTLVEYIRAHTGVCYHPAGTCRMGPDDRAVVTPDLRVKDIQNLWIADASVMPDMVSGNINAACMMIGEHLGKRLAADRRNDGLS